MLNNDETKTIDVLIEHDKEESRLKFEKISAQVESLSRTIQLKKDKIIDVNTQIESYHRNLDFARGEGDKKSEKKYIDKINKGHQDIWTIEESIKNDEIKLSRKEVEVSAAQATYMKKMTKLLAQEEAIQKRRNKKTETIVIKEMIGDEIYFTLEGNKKGTTYILSEKELILEKVDKSGIPQHYCICLGFKIIGSAFNAETGSISHLISFKTIEGKVKNSLISLKDTKQQIVKKLSENGFHVADCENKGAGLFIDFLARVVSVNKLKGYSKIGWSRDKAFITSNYVITNDDIKQVIYENNVAYNAKIGVKGISISYWETFTPYIKPNKLLLFMICATLAAPALPIINNPNFGLTLVGASMSGKSTILNVCASLAGKYDDYKLSWNTTTAALEDKALKHNNLPLIIDDMSHHANTYWLAEQIYGIGLGEFRSRSTQDGNTKPKQTFSTVCLTSGEHSPEIILGRKGIDINVGQNSRMISILAVNESEELGVFNSLCGFKSRAHFCRALNTFAAKFYGSVFHDCVKKLHEIIFNKELRKTFLVKYEEYREEFLDLLNLEHNRNQRIPETFACVASLGALYSDFGVLPFNMGEIFSAAIYAYDSTLEAQPKDYDCSIGTQEDIKSFEKIKDFLSKEKYNYFTIIDRIEEPKDERSPLFSEVKLPDRLPNKQHYGYYSEKYNKYYIASNGLFNGILKVDNQPEKTRILKILENNGFMEKKSTGKYAVQKKIQGLNKNYYEIFYPQQGETI